MLRLMIVTEKSPGEDSLYADLSRYGLSCFVVPFDGAMEGLAGQSPDIVLLDMDGRQDGSGRLELALDLKRVRPLPVMAIVPGEMLGNLNGHLNNVDDFITGSGDARELVFRVNRLFRGNRNTNPDELISCGGLVINLATCEVTVEGRLVDLTFKEYELLKLMAGNRGRVYTREALLDKVWGYDYYGGDRTVDVHIRRLRSKIEYSNHTFIETVRNIGYRFRKDD